MVIKNMAELQIVDLLGDKTNTLYYEVVEDDNWRFPSHGIFRTKEEAQGYIELMGKSV